jgi:hypothetical protein
VVGNEGWGLRGGSACAPPRLHQGLKQIFPNRATRSAISFSLLLVYASNQVGEKQSVCPAFSVPDHSFCVRYDGWAIRLTGSPNTYLLDLALRLKRNVLVAEVRVGRFGVGRFIVGFSRGRVVCPPLGEELKLTLVEVESQSDLAVVALPEFRLEAALNVDGISFFEVLGDGLGRVTEEVGFVPDWSFGPILTGASDFICAD